MTEKKKAELREIAISFPKKIWWTNLLTATPCWIDEDRLVDWIEKYKNEELEREKRRILKTIDNDIALTQYEYKNKDMEIGKEQTIKWIKNLIFKS